MKSKSLRKLIAGVAMLAMSMTVVSGGFSASAAITAPNFEAGWTVNSKSTVNSLMGQAKQLAANPNKTEETIFSVERINSEVLTNDTTVNTGNSNKTYRATESEGGVVRLGIRLNGRLETSLRSAVDRAVTEYRNNVNTVNANKHNSGTKLENTAQRALAEALSSSFLGKDEAGRVLNENVKFIVTYETSDGRVRTTSVNLSDISLDDPVNDSSSVNSVSDLRSLVDENGLVYLTIRGLPTNVNVTNLELDSRSDFYAVTDNNAYSVQKGLNYNAGRVYVPTSTWVLTGSLHPTVTVNGTTFNQFNETNNNKIIERGEHVFVEVTGSTVTLVDILRDPDKTVTGVSVTDRRGNTYTAEVGDFAKGKYTQQNETVDVDYSTRYRDIKITGLTSKNTYDFEYMDITYRAGDVERTQRVGFNNKVATGNVTSDKYLTVATSDYLTSQLYTYGALKSNVLYQTIVGQNSLTYLVKVEDTTNLDRLEVRGLRGGETYTVENVKTQDGKKDKSNWFAVKISNLEENRDYSFLSLETVYSENGRERYGNPVSLGRSSNSLDDVLFPGNDLGSNRYNQFTTTNRNNVSELWVDSNLKYEEIPGGVRFYGRIKDADNILDKVSAYVNNGGSYERIDDSNVEVKKTYRMVKGMDVNNNGSANENTTITYPYLSANNKLNVNESNVESASEMVEITIKGIQPGKNRDFKFDFSTNQDGNRVSTILTGEQGAFGSIPTNGTKTQQTVTRYASGRAGNTKVQVGTTNVQVSNVTSTTANVTARITNPDKEGINVEVKGANEVVAKYNSEKNIIELTGLKSGTEYSNLKLTLKYGDKSTTIDVPTFKTASGNNGSATGTGVTGYVTRVYRTFFDREPDQAGLLYWTERLINKTETLSSFLGQLSFTPELLEKNLTNNAFVEKMYAIVDRTGEAEGIKFWVSEIEKSIATGSTQSEARAAVVRRMLETDEVKGIALKLGINF